MKIKPDNPDIADIKTPIENISGVTWAYIKEKYGLKVYFIFGGIILFEIIILKSLFLVVATLIGASILYSKIYSKIENRFYEQIAELNGYTYTPKGFLEVHGHIFQIGDSPKFEDIIMGEFEKHPIKIFVYKFTTGSGKQRSRHSLSVCEITFPDQMPNMILNAHNFSSFNAFDFRLKKLKLEGDFHKYFTLYCEPGREIEALQIFTPDVMQDFIQQSKMFDLEFSKNKIYLIATKKLQTRQEILTLFGFAHHLIVKLKNIVPRLKI